MGSPDVAPPTNVKGIVEADGAVDPGNPSNQAHLKLKTPGVAYRDVLGCIPFLGCIPSIQQVDKLGYRGRASKPLSVRTEEELGEHLEPLLARLGEVLARRSSTESQLSALGAISSAAYAAQGSFRPYAPAVLPLLRQYMGLTQARVCLGSRQPSCSCRHACMLQPLLPQYMGLMQASTASFPCFPCSCRRHTRLGGCPAH